MQNYEYRIVHLGLNLNCQGKSALRELSLNGWRIHKVVPQLKKSTKIVATFLTVIVFSWLAIRRINPVSLYQVQSHQLMT